MKVFRSIRTTVNMGVISSHPLATTTSLTSGTSSLNRFRTPSFTATTGTAHLPHEHPFRTLKVIRKLLNAVGTPGFSSVIVTTPSLTSTRAISPRSAFRTGRMLSCMISSILSNISPSFIGRGHLPCIIRFCRRSRCRRGRLRASSRDRGYWRASRRKRDCETAFCAECGSGDH